jgi:dTDP-4-amino-4,6-dideoxygalactose transaminase
MSNTEMPPPIAWFGPHLTGRELERLRDVLDRQRQRRPLAREFERQVAALVGTRHAVAVTSGTATDHAGAVAAASVRAMKCWYRT